MVVGGDEAVPLRDLVRPLADAALAHLDHAMAALADEVMVVRVGAEPEALLVSRRAQSS